MDKNNILISVIIIVLMTLSLVSVYHELSTITVDELTEPIYELKWYHYIFPVAVVTIGFLGVLLRFYLIYG